jgi:hypothetical protein
MNQALYAHMNNKRKMKKKKMQAGNFTQKLKMLMMDDTFILGSVSAIEPNE